jgi:transcriptional regulator with XRE-family HTH domain
MPDSFGARLRQQREARQIDLVAIAEQTKIKLALLEALENDDVSHWPSGIFRRAYIRAYAQFIGLDPDVLLREFLEVHADPGDAIVSSVAGAAAAEEEYAKHAPSMRFRSIFGSALGSLTRLRRSPLDESRPTAGTGDVPTSSDTQAARVDPVSAIEFRGRESETRLELDTEFEPEPEMTLVQSEQVLVEAVECGPVPDAEPTEAEVPAAAIPLPPDPEAPAVVAAAPVDAAAGQVAQDDHDATLETVASLCTEFGRVVERAAVRELLQQSADALSAAGLIVWLADESGEALRPGLVHGYSDRVLAQLPAVTRDADNATAAAFRTARWCEVAATDHTSGALVVPLLVPDGCAGVLAIELQQGVQATRSLRSVAVIVAAALTQLVYRSRPTDRPAPVERPAPAVAQFRQAARPMKVRR